MPSRKQNQTQKLIEDIFIRHHCKSIVEAQEIYRRKYEVDKELDPAKVDEFERGERRLVD